MTALTTQQLAVIKADILADPILNAYSNSADGAFAIAVVYNSPAVPDYFVWRRSVPINEIMSNGFDWTRVDNLTVGKARIWEWMTQLGAVNMAEPNVRAGVNACFSVASGDAPNRLAVFTHGSRLATRYEKLFAVGSGLASTDLGVGPSTTTLESPVDYSDIQAARDS